MIDSELRKSIDSYCDEREISPLLFENPAFDKSIVGISDDERIVYDYDSMVDELAEDDNIPYDEAVEFIDYNTMRAIPYGGEAASIIIEMNTQKLRELY